MVFEKHEVKNIRLTFLLETNKIELQQENVIRKRKKSLFVQKHVFCKATQTLYVVIVIVDI